MIRFLSLIVLLMTLTRVQAEILLPNAISSNMVLQRAPQAATIWGTAPSNAIVVVTLDSEQYKVFADLTGNWEVTFRPQSASVDRTIMLEDDQGSAAVTLSNIAFGDVYVCSGQSNMEFSVTDSFDAKTAIPDSSNYAHLRLFTIAEKASYTPLTNTTNRFSDDSRWVVSAPQYVGGPSFNYFSATCYYFGRELYKAINTDKNDPIPVGIIDTCWGGTRIEAWTTKQYLDQCGPVVSSEEYLKSLKTDMPNIYDEAMRARTSRSDAIVIQQENRPSKMFSSMKLTTSAVAVDDDISPQDPSVLFNGQIAPITKFKICGVTWYQGEANANNATNYACRFPAMIEDWRQQFNNYDLWFGYVLLAAYKEGGNPTWPLIRDAQNQALALPLVHVSSAQDLGDESSPQGSIHPRNKTFVGARLALGAQATIYHQNVISVGPSVADIIWPLDKSSSQSVILRFASGATFNQGLNLKDTSQCDLCCKSVNGSALTVGTSDGAWRRAEVSVDSNAYIAIATVNSLPSGVFITGVQHGYEDYQQCAIYNAASLPLLPFNITRF